MSLVDFGLRLQLLLQLLQPAVYRVALIVSLQLLTAVAVVLLISLRLVFAVHSLHVAPFLPGVQRPRRRRRRMRRALQPSWILARGAVLRGLLLRRKRNLGALLDVWDPEEQSPEGERQRHHAQARQVL